MNIPFLDLARINAPYMESLAKATEAVVRSGRYIGGEACAAFEQALGALCAGLPTVGVSNGLDAISLIFRALIAQGRLAPGDRVLVPANTYIASFLAVSHAGLVPVAVDADPRTMNMDTVRAAMAAEADPRVRAVLTVHLYGRPCWDKTLAECARRHNLAVVEDNAQAIGATASVPGFNGSATTGTLGHAAAFSFYPTKNIGALGDAGAVVTADATLADTVRALANYGSDTRYHNIYQGFNCRLDPIQAAALGAKLPHLAQINGRRRQIAGLYNRLIDNPFVTKPAIEHPDGAVWHQYVVRVHERDAFRAHLAGHGIGTDVHYPVPAHLQPCYRGLSHGPLPEAEELCRTVVSLPVGEYLGDREVEYISRVINTFRP